jgi:ubiquinone/menaquinone biosynthesis C-methylase UbiE
MYDFLKLIACPKCGKDMHQNENVLSCECGYALDKETNIFYIKSRSRELNESYTGVYNSEYYLSSLYDLTSYRLDNVVFLVQPKEGMLILDLGCGPGEIAIKCAKAGAWAIGVDVSKDALKICSQRASNQRLDIKLFEFNGKDLPFKDSIFDAIVLADVAEHVTDDTLNHLFEEIQRTLKPDGRVVIHTWPTKNLIIISDILRKATLGRLDIHSRLVTDEYEFLHVRYHSKRSLEQLMHNNSLYPVIWGGFQYISCQWFLPLKWPFLQDLLGDQLWGLGFKNPPKSQTTFRDKPYLDYLDVPDEICLGRCEDILINYGLYYPEMGSFRWTKKVASIFIKICSGCKVLYIQASTSNPYLSKGSIGVNCYLSGKFVGRHELETSSIADLYFTLPKGLRNGIVELKIVVDRTFVPKDLGINDDPRDLGIALYQVRIR